MPRCYTCKRRPFTDHSRPLKQLCLGGSQDKQLCLLPPSTSQSHRHYSTSVAATPKDGPLNLQFITKIPDELLNEIFTHAIQSEVGQIGVSPTALTLCTVSRRFHRIVQPHLYRSLDLSHHSLARPCLAVRLLHRTLKENPILGHVVTTLHVHVNYQPLSNAMCPGDFAIGVEILNLLPNVEMFEIQAGYEYSPTWPMVHDAIMAWKQIRHVRLFREDFSLFMSPIFELVEAKPSLTTLELHGAGEEMGSTPRAVRNQKEIERTSAITTLIIHDFSSTPSALQYLLLLPKALSHFTFGKIHHSPATWTLTQFQTLLAPHQETLTHIEIGRLGSGPINFCSFPKLEVLQLSDWIYRATPEEAASSLLAPKLNTFIWDFRVIDQHSESWDDFSTPQKEWVIRFAKLASERKSRLRKIEIVFRPDNYEGPRTREELAVYITPWDLMDEAREKIGELGIELVYNKCWSRQECLEELINEGKFRNRGSESGDEISLLSANEEN